MTESVWKIPYSQPDSRALEQAGFPREEIIRGMEDALRLANMEIPEYLRLD